MFVCFPSPIDKDTVLFVAHDERGSGPWLWSLDLPSRSTRRVSVGPQEYTSLAASADGRKLVATVSDPKSAIWTIPLRKELVREEDANLFPGVSSLRALAPLFGGEELFYMSSRGSKDGLYMLRDGRVRQVWRGASSSH